MLITPQAVAGMLLQFLIARQLPVSAVIVVPGMIAVLAGVVPGTPAELAWLVVSAVAAELTADELTAVYAAVLAAAAVEHAAGAAVKQALVAVAAAAAEAELV